VYLITIPLFIALAFCTSGAQTALGRVLLTVSRVHSVWRVLVMRGIMITDFLSEFRCICSSIPLLYPTSGEGPCSSYSYRHLCTSRLLLRQDRLQCQDSHCLGESTWNLECITLIYLPPLHFSPSSMFRNV